MSEYWSMEAHDKTGQVFLHLTHVADFEVAIVLAQALQDPKTGGVVIYRPVGAPRSRGGDDDGDEELGLVRDEGLGLVADQGDPPCTYCTTRGGHTADCVTIS